MNKKEWKTILSLLQELWGRRKSVLICMFLMSVSQGVRPYVSVILTGYLIDAAYVIIYRGEKI